MDAQIAAKKDWPNTSNWYWDCPYPTGTRKDQKKRLSGHPGVLPAGITGVTPR